MNRLEMASLNEMRRESMAPVVLARNWVRRTIKRRSTLVLV